MSWRQKMQKKNLMTQMSADISHKSLRNLDEKHGGIVLPKKLTGCPNNITKFIKYFQCPVFYERELRMWRENKTYKGLPLQLFLFHNRLEYLGKSPAELSDIEILRGFGIAGILKSYPRFDTTVLNTILTDYGVASVYDPCAGWGERMICCVSRGVNYYGVDVNDKLWNGYQEMLDYLQIPKDLCVMRIEDAALVDNSMIQADVVFTCPPYHNVEIYTEKGAENLNYQDFLNWWNRVVRHALQVQPLYFMFQINQKYRQDMVEIVLQNGFEFVEEREVKQKSSHRTRLKDGQNVKKEYESVLICKRKE